MAQADLSSLVHMPRTVRAAAETATLDAGRLHPIVFTHAAAGVKAGLALDAEQRQALEAYHSEVKVPDVTLSVDEDTEDIMIRLVRTCSVQSACCYANRQLQAIPCI